MANESPDDRYLTVAEVAERLKVHPITVRRHIKAGLLRAVRIGRAVRIRESDLEKYMGHEVDLQSGEQAVKRREAARRLVSMRERSGPLYMTTGELVREGRRQLELRGPRWRKPFDDMRALREQMKPLGISTAELVRQARAARQWMYGDDGA